ncbi:hypothetical protein [Candidatus Nitrosotenuis uzonensis]|jgi:hypothetical protein|nr:hypothetical protein [Candidatus Nitrosotenuis uzonensis]
MNTTHAQELLSIDADDTKNDTESFKNNVHLWAPSKMIKGETYEGLVVLSDAATAGELVLITSSDKTIIETPKSITILPESNHGIFEIKTLKEGNARIFASVNGEVTSTDVRVYSSSSTPDKLGMFLPSNSTKTAKVPVYVFTLDRNGSPASAKHDVTIHLSSSSEMIKVPESVTVKNQTYYSRFTAEVNGGGKITASAQNLNPGTIDVKRQQENVDVLMGIAPNIALENSEIYYYVWLEKDGKPFKPPHVVDVFLSSNDPKVARLAPRGTSQHYGDGTIHAKMIDGIARGTLFTGEKGTATISANVGGFGYAQADLVVGPVTFSNDESLSNEVQSGSSSGIQVNSTNPSRIDAIYQPNIALSWVFPAKTSDKAYGVAALYWQNVTKSVNTSINEIDGTAVQSMPSTHTLVPLPLDDRTINIASQAGLLHKTVYQMSQSNRLESTEGKGRLSAIEFELVSSNQGDYTISVSGPGLDISQTKLRVIPEHTESYKIGIVPLPSRPEVRQDLAIVSILDKDGNLVDSGTQNKDIEIVTSKVQETSIGSVSGQSVSIVRGEVSEQASIVASANKIGTTSADIIPAGISTAIEFELPEIIHVGEPAPYVIHEVDIFGTPLAKIKPIGMSTSGGIEIDRNKEYLITRNHGQGKVAVLADAGADTKSFEAFSNTMSVEVVIEKEKVRVGEKTQLAVISDIPNLEITIDSAVTFAETKEQDDESKNIYLAYPDREGIFDVTVTAQKDGYAPITKSLSFEAVSLFDLAVKAVSTQDGKEISAKHTLVISNQTVSKIGTPYHKELGPSEITMSFPPEQKTGDKSYLLKKIRIGNEEFFDDPDIEFFLNNNTEVTAYYDRMIKVDVAGAEGSGFYPYGETVTLSVPPKDKASFFVRDVFDHWEGLPYDTEPVSFTASEDISAKVVYRDDYTFLMLVVAAIVTTVLYTTAIRNKVNLRWEISKLVDLLRNNIKVGSPKISQIRESLEGKKKKFSWQLKRKEESNDRTNSEINS